MRVRFFYYIREKVKVKNYWQNFSHILNDRLKMVCEIYNILGEEQNGFRKDRRSEDNIYIIRELIDRSNRERSTLYQAFLIW